VATHVAPPESAPSAPLELSGQSRVVQTAAATEAVATCPGLTPTAVMEKLAMIQMIDVWIPTLDGRWLILPRYTQPEKDTKILLQKLKLELPTHPPPRITAHPAALEPAS